MSILTDIAGRFAASETNVAGPVGGGWVKVASANPARYAIGFTMIPGSTAVLSIVGVESGIGIPIGGSAGLVWLTAREHGSLAQSAWFCDFPGIGDVLTVYEVIDNEG